MNVKSYVIDVCMMNGVFWSAQRVTVDWDISVCFMSALYSKLKLMCPRHLYLTHSLALETAGH